MTNDDTITMDEEQLKLYADFQVTTYNTDGNVVQQNVIEDTGSFTMEDLKMNAIANGVDEIEVEVLGFETRRGDQTEIEVERT